MDWGYNSEGIWDASSEQNDDGDRFTWRIVVNRDGLFCVVDSDAELTDHTDPFDSLADAKMFCQASENAWLSKARRATLAAAQAEFEKPHAEATAQQRGNDEAYVASPYTTLKPLIWEDYSSDDYPTRLFARVLGLSAYVWQQGDRFRLSIGDGASVEVHSAAHGKQLAWEHYRQQVAKLFERGDECARNSPSPSKESCGPR